MKTMMSVPNDVFYRCIQIFEPTTEIFLLCYISRDTIQFEIGGLSLLLLDAWCHTFVPVRKRVELTLENEKVFWNLQACQDFLNWSIIFLFSQVGPNGDRPCCRGV